MAYLVPSSVPSSVYAGDTVTWTRTLAEYPASAGWVLSYVLVSPTAQKTLTATADGDRHHIEVAAATTASWPSGDYHYVERVTRAGKSYTLASGTLTVRPNLLAATGGLDVRSHAQKTLAALEAWIEGRDMAVAEYEIAGRRLRAIPISDLLLLRDRLRREVRQQAGGGTRVYVRF